MPPTSSTRYFNEYEQDTMWRLWYQGHSLSDIGRHINKHAASVFCYFQRWGGIKPRKPVRSQRSLTLVERETISRGLSANLSIRAIARQLGRAPSTVSREINRNGGIVGYRAVSADTQAWQKAKRPKLCKLLLNPVLRQHVSDKLAMKWSPEQIAGWLKRMYPRENDMQVSHETIYRTLYIQARGALKKELQQYLRSRRKMRQSKHNNTKAATRGGIVDAVSIHERPMEVDARRVPGHWEGDLICGTHQSYVATLVERSSRYTLLVKVKNNDTQSVVSALTKKIKTLPDQLRKTLTWDRGVELSAHKQFTIDTDIKVYFCDPQSPWQRGTNENTNRLLRQYMPKRTDLSIHSQKQLDKIAMELNERPRKTLNYLSPAEKIIEVLQ